MNVRTISILFAAYMLTGSNTLAAGDAQAGQLKAETCLGCHAVQGYYNVYPTYRVPKLGGQNAKYIETALKAYRDGSREHGTMKANADNLSDQDMADIGSFIESQRK